MSDAAPLPVKPRVLPVALRPAAERYAHVVARLKERGGIDWTVERCEVLEKKIKFCRIQVSQQKKVVAILPQKIGEDIERRVQFWRVLINNQPHLFVWSQICRGLISYKGPGDTLPVNPSTEAPSIAPTVVHDTVCL